VPYVTSEIEMFNDGDLAESLQSL